MKMLKISKSLPIAAMFLAAATFWACSETENPQDAGVWVDDPAIAQLESSSSSLWEIESSETIDASSSSVQPKSSSSVIEGIHIPTNMGCVPDNIIVNKYELTPEKAPKMNGVVKAKPQKDARANGVSYAATAMEKEEYGVLSAFVKKRVEVLEGQGSAHDSAWIQAADELFRELGLDSLFADRQMPTYYVEYTLFYLYGDGINQLSTELVEDFADGKLESKNYCFNNLPYNEFDRAAHSFMPIGCAYSEHEIIDPESIIQNIWRKCSGMPYCSDAIIGTFNKDSSLICKKNKYSSWDDETYTNWEIASPLDIETSGIPCDADGKYLVSHMDPKRSYICSVDKGWDSTTTIQIEMANVPCEKHGELFKSELNPGAIYICRDTLVRDNYWEDEYPLNTWEIATPFEAEIADTPCDKNGEMVKSVVAPDSFHICRDGIWNTATRLEKETREIPCDEEGKRVESQETISMYYVCHEGKWYQFDELPCEDGARYSTVNGSDTSAITNYACKGGKWYTSGNESWETPYELYFNPELEYGTFTDPRDNHVYRTIDFQGTTWMAENLKYQGTPETFEVDKKFCKNNNCENSGYFYTMENAEQTCPEGWRLPTKDEVSLLNRATALDEDGKSYPCSEVYNGCNVLFSQMTNLGLSATGLDSIAGVDKYGMSFTNTGVFNGESHVNYYYQYFWFHDNEENEIFLAEISTYEITLGDRFHDVREDIKAPVRCVKE